MQEVAAVTRWQGGGGSANGKSRLWEQTSKRRALPQLRDPTLTALQTQTRDIDFELVLFRTSFKVPGLRLLHGDKKQALPCLEMRTTDPSLLAASCLHRVPGVARSPLSSKLVA